MKKNKSINGNLINELHMPEITEKHTGKMVGMQSLSTSCACNSRCEAHCKVDGSICQKCYAQTIMTRYEKLDEKTERNYKLLTASVLPMEYLPTLNCAFFRFEAFGDLEGGEKGINQFTNYVNICRKNPFTNFALWTKNPDVIEKAFWQGVEKPANLKLIVSPLFMDVLPDNRVIKSLVDHYKWIDHVFTVFTFDFLKNNGFDGSFINCGARSCLACNKCYSHRDNTPFFINELLKQDVAKAKKAGFIIE